MSKRQMIFFTFINSLNMKKHAGCLLLDYHIYYYDKWNGLPRNKLTKIGLSIQKAIKLLTPQYNNIWFKNKETPNN